MSEHNLWHFFLSFLSRPFLPFVVTNWSSIWTCFKRLIWSDCRFSSGECNHSAKMHMPTCLNRAKISALFDGTWSPISKLSLVSTLSPKKSSKCDSSAVQNAFLDRIINSPYPRALYLMEPYGIKFRCTVYYGGKHSLSMLGEERTRGPVSAFLLY
jgi:hypothetical protein